MLFNSYAYLLVFLPFAVAGYFAIGRRSPLAANAFLAALSVVFYAYWKLAFVPILALSIAVNFAVGRILSRRAASGATRGPLAAGIAFNLGLLGLFKYADFFVENLNAATGAGLSAPGLLLPLGISFFTFTQVAYLVDAARGQAREYAPVNYVLFVTFFPHLLAGPIIHHREMMPQFADPALKKPDWDNLARGLALVVLGLAKKVLVADTLAPWADAGFASAATLTFADAWIAMTAYAMQLVFDFGGYTDMALGAALMVNIRLPLNFDAPYRAANLQEFWRRWHMTLSRFLRDYVYIPLGGNRKGEARTMALFVVTFVVGGFWHGAAWTFVAWGLAHGLGLVVFRLWTRTGYALPRPAAIAVTALFAMACFVIFRASSLADAGSILGAVAGLKGFGGGFSVEAWAFLGRSGVPAGELVPGLAVLATLGAALVLQFTPRTAMNIVERMDFRPVRVAAFGGLAALALAFVANPSEFIYFIF